MRPAIRARRAVRWTGSSPAPRTCLIVAASRRAKDQVLMPLFQTDNLSVEIENRAAYDMLFSELAGQHNVEFVG